MRSWVLLIVLVAVLALVVTPEVEAGWKGGYRRGGGGYKHGGGNKHGGGYRRGGGYKHGGGHKGGHWNG
ncbi:Uncharacterised protein g2111 [Pycnogonum litorale]